MEKITFGKKFRALLGTGRIANLPTVWSNVLVGFWIASSCVHEFQSSQDHSTGYLLLLIILVACSLIYVGGCMLGDAQDHDFDRINRPARPIPSGILSAGGVKLTSFSLLTIAIFLLFVSTLAANLISWSLDNDLSLKEIITLLSNQNTLHAIQLHEMLIGVLLTAVVITYAYYHKRNRKAALTMMASCRFLLVFLGIAVTQKTYFTPNEPLGLHLSWVAHWMLIYPALIGFYTLLLSWVASTESQPGRFSHRKLLGACMLSLPFLSFITTPLIFNHHKADHQWSFMQSAYLHSYLPSNATCFYITLAITTIWIFLALKRLNSSKPAFVSRALAGFCLIDATIVAPFSPSVACVCITLFLLALLLQRVTPAT